MMRIVLLQDEIYLPSLGGATKANRFLLEALVRRGHECLAVTRALTRSPDGPRDAAEFHAVMDARGINVTAGAPDVYSYTYRGVQVWALDHASDEARRSHLLDWIPNVQPDWVLVADDKRRFMVDAAIRTMPERTVLLLQTVIQAPFGPLALQPCSQQASRMRQARGIIVISRFLRDYLQNYGGLSSEVRTLPFYGEGPFPLHARFDHGFVTMINPCPMKGVAIFRALAEAFPDYPFAAVPTWGADNDVLQQLRQLPNVRLLDPADDIDVILAQTRILLAPSLWPETFGYVVPEAMLRGIPVLASDLGGLPEAKLEVDYLLPVSPAQYVDGDYVFPAQDTAPWSHALRTLLSDPHDYQRCSLQSRAAAMDLVARAEDDSVEDLLVRWSNSNAPPS